MVSAKVSAGPWFIVGSLPGEMSPPRKSYGNAWRWRMRFSFRLLVFALVALGLLAGTAGARPDGDARQRMDLLYTNPNNAVNSDLAFWGNHAFIGYYTGDTGSPAGTGPRGGVRIFDISNPAGPTLVKDIQCDANQNDPIVWDRNGNGVADLLLMAVDRTMASPECGAPRVAHGDPTGWEGVRVFELSPVWRHLAAAPCTDVQIVPP
jgi:hypothetical protein